MKNSVLLLLCMVLISCQKKEKVSGQDLPFFHFDKIEYYHTAITPEEFKAIGMKQEKDRKEQALWQIINGKVPVNTMDTLFIRNMDILSFKKYTVDAKWHAKIGHLFAMRTGKTKAENACAPAYRDILIFRKKDKVIGVAKICFDCNRSQIVGARYDASAFGQSGEYDALHTILSETETTGNSK